MSERHTLPRLLAAASLLLAAPWTTVGCGACSDSEERGPVVKGPVRAEFVVFKEAWGKISRSARDVHGEIVIETDPPTRHVADCHEPDRALTGDSTGTRFAYRCATSEAWRLVYPTREGRSWQACKTTGGSAAEVDWAALPTLEAAAPELASCAGKRAGPLLADLMAVRPALAADVLIATAGESFDVGEKGDDDAWLAAEKTLPRDEGTRVHDAVKKAALAPGAAGGTVLRALVLVGREGLGDAAIFDRFAELVAAKPVSRHAGLFLAVASRMLVKGRGSEVGERLCPLLIRPWAEEPGWRGGRSSLHMTTALAASGVSCPAFASKLGCGWGYDCQSGDEPSHLCSPAELKVLLETEMARDPMAAARGDDVTWSADQAELLVAHNAGVVPPAFVTRNARRRYAQVPAEPECWRVDRIGGACRCFVNEDWQQRFVCDLDPAARSARLEDCEVTIDDAARTLRATKQCKKSGHCNQDVDCCGGSCVDSFCREPGAASAAPSGSGAAGAGSTAPSTPGLPTARDPR
jgi:hypothetical protein